MAVCISTGEYVWQIVLALAIFWLGLVVFMKGRQGRIRFAAVIKLENNKRLAQVIAFLLWGVALLTLSSTVFGWGCPVSAIG